MWDHINKILWIQLGNFVTKEEPEIGGKGCHE